MKYQCEKLETSLEEAKPLLQEHWQEVATYKDIPLDPDYTAYFYLEKIGILKCFSARDDDGTLFGYAVFFIKNHLHYQKSLCAVQDIIYIDPDRRGRGILFLRWCDEELAKLGVQIVTHHVKATHNFGPALERSGYKLQDLLYTKRLDK